MEARFLPATSVMLYDPHAPTIETIKGIMKDSFGKALEGIVVDSTTSALTAINFLKQKPYDLVIAGCYKDTCSVETSAGMKVLEGMSLASQVIILSADLEFTQAKLEELGVPKQKINLIHTESKPLRCWEKPLPLKEPMFNYFNVIETPLGYDMLVKTLATTLKLKLD